MGIRLFVVDTAVAENTRSRRLLCLVMMLLLVFFVEGQVTGDGNSKAVVMVWSLSEEMEGE